MTRTPIVEPLSAFPRHTTDTLRFRDTDRQGHVNNAVFSTFLESGRVHLFHDPAAGLQPATGFVLAHLAIDFRAELFWPGVVSIGTRVARIGTSSITFAQALYQEEKCVASAQSVVVLLARASRKPTPLSDATRLYMQRWT